MAKNKPEPLIIQLPIEGKPGLQAIYLDRNRLEIQNFTLYEMTDHHGGVKKLSPNIGATNFYRGSTQDTQYNWSTIEAELSAKIDYLILSLESEDLTECAKILRESNIIKFVIDCLKQSQAGLLREASSTFTEDIFYTFQDAIFKLMEKIAELTRAAKNFEKLAGGLEVVRENLEKVVHEEANQVLTIQMEIADSVKKLIKLYEEIEHISVVLIEELRIEMASNYLELDQIIKGENSCFKETLEFLLIGVDPFNTKLYDHQFDPTNPPPEESEFQRARDLISSCEKQLTRANSIWGMMDEKAIEFRNLNSLLRQIISQYEEARENFKRLRSLINEKTLKPYEALGDEYLTRDEYSKALDIIEKEEFKPINLHLKISEKIQVAQRYMNLEKPDYPDVLKMAIQNTLDMLESMEEYRNQASTYKMAGLEEMNEVLDNQDSLEVNESLSDFMRKYPEIDLEQAYKAMCCIGLALTHKVQVMANTTPRNLIILAVRLGMLDESWEAPLLTIGKRLIENNTFVKEGSFTKDLWGVPEDWVYYRAPREEFPWGYKLTRIGAKAANSWLSEFKISPEQIKDAHKAWKQERRNKALARRNCRSKAK